MNNNNVFAIVMASFTLDAIAELLDFKLAESLANCVIDTIIFGKIVHTVKLGAYVILT